MARYQTHTRSLPRALLRRCETARQVWCVRLPSPKDSAEPRADIVKTLSSRFTSISQQAVNSSSKCAHCYDPSLSQLYAHYIALICGVCFPFVHDIDELAYIAAARWPGFVKPILSSAHSNGAVRIPSEDTRLRLIRIFNPTVTNALESLHPRLTNAADWAAANEPDANVLDQPFGQIHSPAAKPGTGIGTLQDADLSSLPRMSKFILVASYIASTNPAKSDLRMFGRGLDEKKRRRRVVKVQSKTKGPSKVNRPPGFSHVTNLKSSACVLRSHSTSSAQIHFQSIA